MSERRPKIQKLSLLETRGDEPVTYRGHSLPLKVWFAFCESKTPREEMDPEEIEIIAQRLLNGEDPFPQESQ